MSSKACGCKLLVSLPDDILAVIGRSLSRRDICNLSLCCKTLNRRATSDMLWFTHCEMVLFLSSKDLFEWRKAVLSYKALCRFLHSVKPLLGVWVHQNPELGNVVYVMPGFVSVVGCRIIPQELGHLGVEDGPLLWAPVFEVIGDYTGSSLFVLHGRDKNHEYVYPGSVKSVEKTCNVLLLEVEPRKEKKSLVYSRSFDQHSVDYREGKMSRIDSGISKWQRYVEPNLMTVPFRKLSFADRRKLLEIVTTKVCMQIPMSVCEPLFPCLRTDEVKFQKNLMKLSERRLMLIKMHKIGGGFIDWTACNEIPCPTTQIDLSEVKEILDRSSGFRKSLNGDDNTQTQCARKRTFGDYVRNKLGRMLRRSNSINGSHKTTKTSSSRSSENKHAQLHDFLGSGDTIGLTLNALTMKLSSYRAWPTMHDSRCALYKFPIQKPTKDEEFSGLWGGTFGWPPGNPKEDKPGKALFLLALSYIEESLGHRRLIATKLLEGTRYVLHPNGSAMFVVNVQEPSGDPFPWNDSADSEPVRVKRAFNGEGIANGYGFRYPGAKPGSLFVLQDGMLAFMWKESKAVLTLQRLNLEHLLKQGVRVPALPPTVNFSYLTKSNSNVFSDFASMATSVSSLRTNQ